MKIRQLTLLIASASLLALSAGCELIVDFDRDTIVMTGDACNGSCTADSGTDASDDDAGSMDAEVPGDSGMDAEVPGDSGMDADVLVDSGMDAADDEDSGL